MIFYNHEFITIVEFNKRISRILAWEIEIKK